MSSILKTTLAAACAIALNVHAQQWSWSLPALGSNFINDVAFAAGKYVAVGNEGTVLTSANGHDGPVQRNQQGFLSGHG